MKLNGFIRVAVAMTVTLFCGSFVGLAVADDWLMLGRDGTRNGVSPEIGAPVEWIVESREGDRVIRESRGIRWSAPLGSETYSSPVVSDGLVWIGTNSDRDGKIAALRTIVDPVTDFEEVRKIVEALPR